MPNYRNKTLKFNMDNAEDKALWDYLQGLPYGLFSSETKEMWEFTKSMGSITSKYWKEKEPETKHIKLETDNDPNEIRKEVMQKLGRIK